MRETGRIQCSHVAWWGRFVTHLEVCHKAAADLQEELHVARRDPYVASSSGSAICTMHSPVSSLYDICRISVLGLGRLLSRRGPQSHRVWGMIMAQHNVFI
jgi:hypothetical protein